MVVERSIFDTQVDLIYRASTGETSWESVLRSIADAFNASFAAFAIEQCELSQVRAVPAQVTPPRPVAAYLSTELGNLVDLYYSRYYLLDPFLSGQPVTFAPSIQQLQDVCDPKDFAKGEYYRDFARLADSFHLTRFSARFDTKLQIKVALNRSESGRPLNAIEVAQFDSLTTHLMRALKVQRHVTQMGATTDAAFGALEQTGRAALLIDRAGRIIRMNALSESISAEDDGITIRNRRLVLEEPSSQHELRQAMLDRLGESMNPVALKSAAIAVQRPSGRRPYLMEITPFEFESYWSSGTAATALVTIRDPEAAQRSAKSGNWGSALGLTRSEWRVARTLATSRDEVAVAEALGISVNTVKTHRKRIYAKLGIHRRAELSAMLPSVS